MANIAYYQEGYTDGFDSGRETTKLHYKHLLNKYIEEQTEKEPNTEFLQGFNCALSTLRDFIEVL